MTQAIGTEEPFQKETFEFHSLFSLTSEGNEGHSK